MGVRHHLNSYGRLLMEEAGSHPIAFVASSVQILLVLRNDHTCIDRGEETEFRGFGV